MPVSAVASVVAGGSVVGGAVVGASVVGDPIYRRMGYREVYRYTTHTRFV